MDEKELLQIGFFETNANLRSEEGVKYFKLYEYYNGVFVRIIVSKHEDVFVVDHLYFNSPKSVELQEELFGNDLTIENIIKRIKAYRENSEPSDDGPETF
jgi:hypothetical protein